tara:strand:+ start:17268 stop:18404 length:1137 start_codon:yes stop_codon:yes gene_type:complete
MGKLCSLLIALLLAIASDADAGPTTLHYNNGSPRWIYSMESGVPSGESTMYYPDGAVMVKGAYKVGLKHGLFLYYTQEGTIKERSLFVHGERAWQTLGADQSEAPPLALLDKPPRVVHPQANTARLKDAPLPFLPFASMDRYSRRMGILLGTSSENGEMNGRRIEAFAHLVHGRLGLYFSASQSFITGQKVGARDETEFRQEQGTIDAALTHFVGTVFDTHILARVGYLRSAESDPQVETPIRGINRGQRAADYVASLEDARAYRASASLVRRWRRFIGQMDLGLDVFREAIPNTDTHQNGAMFRLNAAAGYFYGNHWQFMLETANTANTNGPSLMTYGGTVNYIGGRLSWLSANMMAYQDSEYSFVLSVGSFLWRLD